MVHPTFVWADTNFKNMNTWHSAIDFSFPIFKHCSGEKIFFKNKTLINNFNSNIVQ